ncbi:MAG: helix-turn-helix transcriptional regulator [Pseudorhodoplanes sp.]|uniref:helix-turn-helix transcriptional regulator n=1 Tax=Pseudorhodoplanes sp. TaxID=1934341 RepID=UPI003D143B3C
MTQLATKRDRSRQLLAVMDRLYHAVSDLDKWPAFLESATTLFGARGAQVGHTDLVNARLSFNMVYGYDWSAAHMQRYESLIGEDPRIPYFSANPFKPVHCRMSLSDEQLHASRVYKEVLSVGGVEYTLGVNLVEDRRSLTYFLVLRDRDQSRFDDEECELMAALIPHLTRALKLQRDLEIVTLEKTAAFDALDGMALGVVVVDADARVRFSNAAARQIAADGDGLRISGQRLVSDGANGDNIRARIRQLLQSAEIDSEPANDVLRIARTSGREGYIVLLSVLGANQARFGWSLLSEPLVLVYIRDPDSPEETRTELLQRLFGLMPSQAKLAELLATGCTLEEAAQRLGITLASARQYLKLIFQKTGTHRQAELVRKVMLVPPAPKWQDRTR